MGWVVLYCFVLYYIVSLGVGRWGSGSGWSESEAGWLARWVHCASMDCMRGCARLAAFVWD